MDGNGKNALIAQYSAPVIYDYTVWVLKKAAEKGIKRLYFLARDGYMLKAVADELLKKWDLGIETRYFYCSRRSLRIPTYHFIGDEAFDLILSGSFHTTQSNVFDRIEMPPDERAAVYLELGLSQKDDDAELSQAAKASLFAKIRSSAAVKKYVDALSRQKYPETIGYIEQEGMLDKSTVAVVDTGWTGSVQRSLRQLIGTKNPSVEIVGFYFGLYNFNFPPEDGEYNSFLFDGRTNPYVKAVFNNNLLEIVCSSREGMTIGYKNENGSFSPVFGDAKTGRGAEQRDLTERIAAFSKAESEKKTLGAYSYSALISHTRKACRALMFRPDAETAGAFEEFVFCDDVSDSYGSSVVRRLDAKEWRAFLFLPRVTRKLFSSSASVPLLFWPYGSLAVSEVRCKSFLRANIFLYDYLRYLKITLFPPAKKR